MLHTGHPQSTCLRGAAGCARSHASLCGRIVSKAARPQESPASTLRLLHVSLLWLTEALHSSTQLSKHEMFGVPLGQQQTSISQGCTRNLAMRSGDPVHTVMHFGNRELSEKLPTSGTSPARVIRNLRACPTGPLQRRCLCRHNPSSSAVTGAEVLQFSCRCVPC